MKNQAKILEVQTAAFIKTCKLYGVKDVDLIVGNADERMSELPIEVGANMLLAAAKSIDLSAVDFFNVSVETLKSTIRLSCNFREKQGDQLKLYYVVGYTF